MRKKPISHRRWEDVKCKEGCTRSLRAIHLVSGALPEPAEPGGSERRQSREGRGKGGAGKKIHYVKDNLSGKYQNVSGTPDRGEEENELGAFVTWLTRRGSEPSGWMPR